MSPPANQLSLAVWYTNIDARCVKRFELRVERSPGGAVPSAQRPVSPARWW